MPSRPQIEGSSERGRRHTIADALWREFVIPNEPQTSPSAAAATARLLPTVSALMFFSSSAPTIGNWAITLATRSWCSVEEPKRSAANVTSSSSSGKTERNP